MTKFLLGMAIVAFTSFCGYVFAKKYRCRKQFFSQLYEFNERFLSEISYYRRPLGDFASKYAYKGEFKAFLQVFFQSMDKGAAFSVRALDKDAFSFLTEEEKATVEDYFQMLGKGDSASQKAYFSSMRERLSKLRTEAVAAYKKYGDLYVKLGFLCGLFILILII